MWTEDISLWCGFRPKHHIVFCTIPPSCESHFFVTSQTVRDSGATWFTLRNKISWSCGSSTPVSLILRTIFIWKDTLFYRQNASLCILLQKGKSDLKNFQCWLVLMRVWPFKETQQKKWDGWFEENPYQRSLGFAAVNGAHRRSMRNSLLCDSVTYTDGEAEAGREPEREERKGRESGENKCEIKK